MRAWDEMIVDAQYHGNANFLKSVMCSLYYFYYYNVQGLSSLSVQPYMHMRTGNWVGNKEVELKCMHVAVCEVY